MGTGSLNLAHSPKIAAWGNRDHEFPIDALINLELRVVCKECVRCRCRAVSWNPWPVRKGTVRRIFDDRIKNHAITSHRHKRSIADQLRKNVLMKMIAIQTYKNRLLAGSHAFDLGNDLRSDAGSL